MRRSYLEVRSVLTTFILLYIFQVELGSLQDTVPTDRIVVLQGGWGLFPKKSSGEILLRLTYKAYVEDEEDDGTQVEYLDTDLSDDEGSDAEETDGIYEQKQGDLASQTDQESFMNELAALLVSKEFQGIVASETLVAKPSEETTNSEATISTSPRPGAEFIPSDSESNQEGSEGNIGPCSLWILVFICQACDI